MKTELKPTNVTIRVLDPSKGSESGQGHMLPVDSSDAEHAIASTTADAAAFTKKTDRARPLPVAFTCLEIEAR